MLKARKKITHKEIKQDKLVTAYFQSKDWISSTENKRRVYTIVGVIVLVIILGFFYLNNRKTKNEEAETKLSAVISLYEQGKFQESINGDPASGVMGLNDIVNNYGSTQSGQTAKLYLGNCYYNLKDYDNALKFFEDYSGGSDLIKASCLSGMGAVYEAKGDLKKAGEYYLKAAKVNKDLITNQENLFDAVRAYNQAGDKENAMKAYTALKNDYPKSKFISDVKRFESDFKN
jgi:tetratricopeptide (TPR) repeat protein